MKDPHVYRIKQQACRDLLLIEFYYLQRVVIHFLLIMSPSRPGLQ